MRLAVCLPITLMIAATAGHAHGHPAACRITNAFGPIENTGSGTLVDVTADGQAGLVLTCAHLFAEGAGDVIVEFPGGARHGALLVAKNDAADLAALEIARPRTAPAALALVENVAELTARRTFRACGFGGDGQLQCTRGPCVGTASDAARVSWKFAGAVRSGDSGGGVFDEQGRLVAVVWGATGDVTYASGGGPLRKFLQRVLGRRAERAFARRPRPAPAVVCPDGTCPLVRPGAGGVAGSNVAPPAGRGPAASGGEKEEQGGGQRAGSRVAQDACPCGDAMAALGERVRTLEDDQRQFARQEQLDQFARVDDMARLAAEGRTERESLAQRIASLASGGKAGRAVGSAAATALGISGPLGWAIVATGAVGAWWIARRLRRGAKPQASDPAPRAPQPAPPRQEATAAAADMFHGAVDIQRPIERDDREARQLLRLSRLEGRDPLQDAVAGRLALDRLDALADCDDDPPRKAWADELRRELRERFNDIAPTKFEPNGEGEMGQGEQDERRQVNRI